MAWPSKELREWHNWRTPKRYPAARWVPGAPGSLEIYFGPHQGAHVDHPVTGERFANPAQMEPLAEQSIEAAVKEGH